MNFKTHNEKDIYVSGSFIGNVITTYDKLVRTFGQPMEGSDDNKTDAEWDIEFEDGEIANIYNWKNGKAYLGSKGTRLDNITKWNIGGSKPIIIKRICNILSNSAFRYSKMDKFIDIPAQDDWKITLDCIEKYYDRLQNKTDKNGSEYDMLYKINKFISIIPSNVMEAFK